MRRYTYIKQINRITGSVNVLRMRASGMHYVSDVIVSKTDRDYLYCLAYSPESITSEDITQQYYDQRKVEVKEQRRERFRNEVDDLTAELTRRRLINDLTDTEEQALIDQIAQLSDEIIASLPYPVLPSD